jgi:hypothetical protein
MSVFRGIVLVERGFFRSIRNYELCEKISIRVQNEQLYARQCFGNSKFSGPLYLPDRISVIAYFRSSSSLRIC